MSTVESLFGSALAAHKGGQSDKARQQYQQVLKSAPKHFGALFLLGKLHLEQRDARKAIKLLRKAVDVKGDEAPAFFELGAAYMQEGEQQRALKCFERVAVLQPQNPAAHACLGDVHRALAAPETAIANYRAALACNPDLPQVELALGESLLDAGAYDEAIALFSALAPKMADNPRPLVNLASAHFSKGDLARAADLYRQACDAFPGEANACAGLALSLERSDAFEEAVDWYRRAIAIDPVHKAAHERLSMLLEKLGRMEEAALLFERAVAAEPGNAHFRAELAWFLVQLGFYDQAEAAAREALRLQRDHGLALMSLGKLWSRRGDFDASEKNYRRLLQQRPGDVGALLGLVEIERLQPGDAGAGDFEALLAQDGLDSGMAVKLHQFLGKLNEKDGRFPEAFGHFKASADISARVNRFDLDGYLARSEAIRTTFDADLVERLSALGSDSKRPIFVTGMPRSGTTLVEQIVASHPDVTGGGEMEILEVLVSDFERLHEGSVFPQLMRDIEGGEIAALAERYLDAARGKAPDGARVTDKSISTFRQIGLAAILFPRARFIHCVRDPLDTCLSCFVQGFNRPSLAYSYDLEQLGGVYRDYLALMAHWRAVLPVEVLDVRYEDLIADQEAQSRRIIAHCGLEWDDACLNYHKNERAVHTASLWQVRQPIYASSVGKWRNYAAQLQPLRDALEGGGR